MESRMREIRMLRLHNATASQVGLTRGKSHHAPQKLRFGGYIAEETRRARKRVRGNAEAWVSALQTRDNDNGDARLFRPCDVRVGWNVRSEKRRSMPPPFGGVVGLGGV